MRRGGAYAKTGLQSEEGDRLQRLARELDDDAAFRRQAASPSRSPRSPSRAPSATPSFRDEQEPVLDDSGPFPQDQFVHTKTYALSAPYLDDGFATSPSLGSPRARRCNAVADELREERLRRRYTREQSSMRRAKQANEAEVAAATQAAVAAEAAAERSGWECQVALRHVEAVEARQMAVSPGKASPTRLHATMHVGDRQPGLRSGGKAVRRARGAAAVVGESGDNVVEDLAIADEAQKADGSSLAYARAELAVAQRELDDRRTMDRGLQRELEKLQANHDPDAAALVCLRRELEDANLEADLSTREVHAELTRARGELSEMDAELKVLRGATPKETVELAIKAGEMNMMQRQLEERLSAGSDVKALQAGRDADAKSLMKVHRENADAMQELQRRRVRDRTIADEIEDIEAALGHVCKKLHSAERSARKDAANVLTGGGAPITNPALLPLSFLMWLCAISWSKLSVTGKHVRAARLEAAQKSTKGGPVGLFDRVSHGLHVRWFELWHRLRVLKRMGLRALNVLLRLFTYHDLELLRMYFALWRAGFHALRKNVKALSKSFGAVDGNAPTSRCFRAWLAEAKSKRRHRSRVAEFTLGYQAKQSAWYVNRIWSAWSRHAAVNRAESKLASLSGSYDGRHVVTEQLFGLRDRQASRKLLSSIWTGWVSLCRAAVTRGHQVHHELIKDVCQMWYFGEVAGGTAWSLVTMLVPAWGRLASRERVKAAAGERDADFYEAQEALERTRRIALDQMDDASGQQATFLAREVATWTTWATWKIWSFIAASKRSDIKVNLESGKLESLSRFIYDTREDEQTWNFFLVTWHGWVRLASVNHTRRNAADLLQDSTAERMDVLDAYSMRAFANESRFRTLAVTFSTWSYQVWHRKTKAAVHSLAGEEDREFILEKAKYAYGVLAMLHEQEISAWRLQNTWMAWAFTSERSRLLQRIEVEASQQKRSSKSRRSSSVVNVLSNLEKRHSAAEAGFVYKSWKEVVQRDSNGDPFGRTTAQISKALSIFSGSRYITAAAQAMVPLIFRSWKLLLPADAKIKEHVTTKVRSQVRFQVNKFAGVWEASMEPRTHRKFHKVVFSAWLGVHLWALQMRMLSFTAGRLLERAQKTEVLTVKQFMFALWACQRGTSPLNRLQPPPLKPPPLETHELSALASLNKLAGAEGGASPGLGRASPNIESVFATDLSGVQPRRLNPNRTFDALENLMAVRSRSWRLVCDIRSMAEGSLLRVGELHEAMLILLEQAARKALRPDEDHSISSAGALGSMADVLRLSAESQKQEQQIQERLKERKALNTALLDCTAGAVRIVLETKGGTAEDARAVKLLGAELCELRADGRKLSDACGALVSRIEDAGYDLRSLADARQELPNTPGAPNAASEGRALDGAGESARHLLQGAAAGINAIKNDAQGLLQYLDASELLRSVAIWGVEGSGTDPAGTSAAFAAERPAAALVSPTSARAIAAPATPMLELADSRVSDSPKWPSPIPEASSSLLPAHASPSGPSKQLAVSWLEDEVLAASGPAGAPRENGGGGASALSALRNVAKPSEPRRVDYRRLGEFQVQWRRPRLQTVWRAWLLFVQLVRRLRGAALDAELQGAIDHLGGRGATYSGPGPHRGLRGAALSGGPSGPAARSTVGAVERLLLG